MSLRIFAPITSLGQLLTRRHDQLQELADDDHPQYLHLNKAAQTIAQNVALPAGITLDGVDISVHQAGAAMAQHGGGAGDHSHQSAGAQGATLDHGLALTGLVPDDDHLQYMVGLGADVVGRQVVNTAAETTIAFVNVGPLANAGLLPEELLWIVWRAQLVNNSGVDQTFRMYLNTSNPVQTLLDSGFRTLPTSDIHRGCSLEARWQKGNTYGDAAARIGAAAAPPLMDPILYYGFSIFYLTDLLAGINLIVGVQFGAASDNLWCQSRGLWIGKCRGPR